MEKGFGSAFGGGMEDPGTSGMDKATGTKGKRPFKEGEGDSDSYVIGRKKRKLPKFSRVLIKALKQGPVRRHICEIMEPFRQKLVDEVGEMFESTIQKFVSSRQMSLPRQIKDADSRTLRVHFKSELAKCIYTQTEITDYHGFPVRIELQVQATGELVTTGQESAAKLEVVVLEGDFSDEDWSRKDFESRVVTGRKEKGSLLIGNLTITLKEGVGMIVNIKFTDNSSWIKSRKFMLGVQSIAECLRIHEGKSEAFKVIERRGAVCKKHYPPKPNDHVWCLENIKKDGPYHRMLKDIGILTVGQFCRTFMRDPQKLRNTLGTRISDKGLQDILVHAQKCDFGDKSVEFMSVELLTDNDKVSEEQPVEEMYGTGSKIDYDKMPISEKLDELRGADSHGKESRPAIQYCNGNPATSTRHAAQYQQSSQHLPFSLSELPSYSSHAGFVLSASVEASKWVTSPGYLSSPLLPQTGPGGLSEVVSCAPTYSSHEGSVEASKCTSPEYDILLPMMSPSSLILFDEFSANNTEQEENGDKQEPTHMHNSCMPGTLKVLDKAVSVVCQSFALSSADTFGVPKRGSIRSSSSRLRTAIAGVQVMLRVLSKWK